nr:hypothetical protein [Tanacetum cinerariifolium]
KAWFLSERKTWKRDKDIINDDETLVSSSFNNLFISINKNPSDNNTTFDKIAAGTKNADGHLLYAPLLNSHNILSSDIAPLLDNAVKLKSILKRKSNELEKPSAKRVRFHSSCKEQDGFSVPQVSAKRVRFHSSSTTRYIFNDDDDKKSNTEAAYMDFLEQNKKFKDVPAAELLTSVVFNLLLNDKKDVPAAELPTSVV